jgi:hypothetical protein
LILRTAAALVFALVAGQPAAQSEDRSPASITAAEFAAPTTRYAHGVLGDAVEWGELRLTIDPCVDCGLALPAATLRIVLPRRRVFEDLAPRLADADGDGFTDVIVVETDIRRGASLAVYGSGGKRAATPFIGQRNRWLAPVGVADLDGDGRVEIAYVETPHLGKVLKIVRLEGDRLVAVAMRAGLTNHRIGDDFIQGGIADCGDGPVILTANADWTEVVATRLRDGKLKSASIGAYRDARSLAGALDCR